MELKGDHEMISDEQLAEIEERCTAATKGPWAWQHFGQWGLTGQYGMRPIVLDSGPKPLRVNIDGIMKPLYPEHPDAAFLAHSKQDMELLLEEVKRLRNSGA